MYVLMDIEWITNKRGYVFPTQIAAMRVEGDWEIQDSFYARVRPRDSTFHLWNHIAYNGGTPEDFLQSFGIYRILTDLNAWLKEDDVLCFWDSDPMEFFKEQHYQILKQRLHHRFVVLREYVYPLLEAKGIKKGNPYNLSEALRCNVYGVAHCAKDDVSVMRNVLEALQYPMEYLSDAPPKREVKPKETGVSENHEVWFGDPYQYDVNARLLHKIECRVIPKDAELKGVAMLEACIKRDYKPCPICMKDEIRDAKRARNQRVLNRQVYNFVYFERSKVFHKRDCKMIQRSTSDIRGSIYYKTCAKTGRQPCKVCNPSTCDEVFAQASPKAQRELLGEPRVKKRSLDAAEQRSVERFKTARKERILYAPNAAVSEEEKDDFYTLTKSGYSFFAAKGYSWFHLRECKRLDELSQLKGFARYQDAVRAGHIPCKYCKPTKKHDVIYPIPITNFERPNESVQDLIELCEMYGYAYQEGENGELVLSTPVGKWRVETAEKPYVIHHINLVKTPENKANYHRQPRLFMSLEDVFKYIDKHDKLLLKETQKHGGD